MRPTLIEYSDSEPNTFAVLSHAKAFVVIMFNMENIEQGRPIEFIRHRRESQGYAKVKNEDRWGGQYSYSKG